MSRTRARLSALRKRVHRDDVQIVVDWSAAPGVHLVDGKTLTDEEFEALYGEVIQVGWDGDDFSERDG